MICLIIKNVLLFRPFDPTIVLVRHVQAVDSIATQPTVFPWRHLPEPSPEFSGELAPISRVQGMNGSF